MIYLIPAFGSLFAYFDMIMHILFWNSFIATPFALWCMAGIQMVV